MSNRSLGRCNDQATDGSGALDLSFEYLGLTVDETLRCLTSAYWSSVMKLCCTWL